MKLHHLAPAVLAASLALTLPAHAEPVTTGLAIATAWYAAQSVAVQLVIQVGISLAISAGAVITPLGCSAAPRCR